MAGMNVTEARRALSDLVSRVAFGGERIVLCRNGKDAAAIISVEDLRLLEELEDQLDIAAAKAALAEPGESIPWDQVRKELGL